MAGSKRGDILVVGGGPAGSAAAITLLNQGHNVALFEKRGINREKVCGDGLAPDAQFALKELDVFDVVEEQALRVPDMSLFGYRLNLKNVFADNECRVDAHHPKGIVEDCVDSVALDRRVQHQVIQGAGRIELGDRCR